MAQSYQRKSHHQMHLFNTNDKPLVYVVATLIILTGLIFAGIAAASLMILTGIIFAGTAVALTVMMPVLIVLSPILLPAIITSSFVAIGLLASGSIGASAIAILFCLYKKEERFRYNLHARGIHEAQQPKGTKRHKKARGGNFSGGGKPPGSDKPAEEIKPPERDKPWEERDKPMEESKPLGGVMRVEEVSSIPEISKVLLEVQKPLGPRRCGPNTSIKRCHQILFAMDSTKGPSVFMKECQKVPRVGALAYKYFTSRDKRNT